MEERGIVFRFLCCCSPKKQVKLEACKLTFIIKANKLLWRS